VGPDGVRELDAVVRTLADGRLSEVGPGIERLRAAAPLLADVAAADAAARAAAAGLTELHELRQRVEREAPHEPLLRWWVVAMLGERAWLDTDLGVIPLAVQVLGELPDEPLATLPVLYVRGRLRRIAAALYLIAPSPGAAAEHLRRRDEAVADFMRAGLTAEAALTRGLSAAIHAIATWEDVLDDLEVVRDARALLGDAGRSVWLPVLAQLHAQVALTAGEIDEADAAIADVERHRALHPVFTAIAAVGRAEVEAVRTGGSDTAVAAMTDALDRMRADHPQLLALSQLRIANLLADLGRAEEARTVGLAGMAWPPTNQLMAVSGALLRVRLGVLEGVTRDADAALPLLGQLAELGHARRAGDTALRMAHDLARAGVPDAAATLRAWGVERLPGEPGRTAWERLWASQEPGTTAASAMTAAAPLEVRVMAPVLEVVRDGCPVPLRSMPAKLLVGLLAAHPDPLHVEQAVDLLWPEGPPELGRPRLNTVVHRLRAALDLAPGTLRRVGDVLLLDPAGWDVDLLRFRACPAEAVGGLAGNLCQVQFPYDDLLVEHRHRLDAQIASARRHDA
jgi:hypothetical protein